MLIVRWMNGFDPFGGLVLYSSSLFPSQPFFATFQLVAAVQWNDGWKVFKMLIIIHNGIPVMPTCHKSILKQ